MDIKQADIGLLLALDALLEERNVTRAAERLNISQPAMSAQLARLRHLFNDQLLTPSGRKMMPTTRALDLQVPLRETLETLSDILIKSQKFDPKKSTRIFKIIAADYLHILVSLPLINAVHKIAPDIQIVLLPFDSKTAWKTLETLEADLLISWGQATPEEARARKLFDERLCMIQRVSHPRGRKKLNIDDLCKLEHIITPPEYGRLSGPLDEELQLAGRKRKVVASVPSFLLAPAIVASSDLVAMMPYRLASCTPHAIEISEIPFTNLQFDMLLSWHPRIHGDAGHKWLRDLVASLFKASE